MMNVFNGYKKIVSFSSKGMYSEAFKKLMDASNNVIAAPKRGEEKKKRKHKGLASGSRHSALQNEQGSHIENCQDPRIGSRKKVPLIVEFVNKPEKGQTIPVAPVVKKLDPAVELERLENNEILNELLDALDEGKSISKADQQFVDECLDRIAELMEELGIEDEDESEDDLYRTFETIDINQFR